MRRRERRSYGGRGAYGHCHYLPVVFYHRSVKPMRERDDQLGCLINECEMGNEEKSTTNFL